MKKLREAAYKTMETYQDLLVKKGDAEKRGDEIAVSRLMELIQRIDKRYRSLTLKENQLLKSAIEKKCNVSIVDAKYLHEDVYDWQNGKFLFLYSVPCRDSIAWTVSTLWSDESPKDELNKIAKEWEIGEKWPVGSADYCAFTIDHEGNVHPVAGTNYQGALNIGICSGWE